MKIKYGIIPTMMGTNAREFETTIERREPTLMEFILIVPELHEWLGKEMRQGKSGNVRIDVWHDGNQSVSGWFIEEGGAPNKLLGTKLQEGDLVMCSILWGR